jgi:hypothetical protein
VLSSVPNQKVPVLSSVPNQQCESENSGEQQMPKFQKGVSGNPGGRPKLPAEVKEMFQARAPEAFEVLCRHLNAKDPRVAVAAATQILDRAYGRPVQSIDADGGRLPNQRITRVASPMLVDPGTGLAHGGSNV